MFFNLWALRLLTEAFCDLGTREAKAIGRSGNALAHASGDLKSDREIVMHAVGKDGAALEHASDELKGDRLSAL